MLNWARSVRPKLRGIVAAMLLTALFGVATAEAASAADPTVAAAGNIACDTTSPYFMAGAGTPTRCHQGATAKLLTGGLSAVLPLGSAQYCCGTLAAFQASYNTSWGAVKAITHPVPGTREYATPGAAGYFDYFNGPGAAAGPAGARGLGYYSFDLGSWHLVALNTNCAQVSCAAGSAQERWLRADLAAHPTSCTLAFSHAPRFSSGHPGGVLSVKPLWQALYDSGAEVVLSAGARDYERFRPLAPSGRFDPAFGIRQFVAGTGGYSLGAVGAPKPNSEVLENKTFGVLELTLHPGSYVWAFVPEAGATFTDSGSGACHGAPPPKAAPPPGGGKQKKHGRCTITGTARNDVLVGTRGNDVICGLGGNDRIDGGDGKDVIVGDSGNDRIRGGRGRDVIRGGKGADVISGGRGSDRLYGQSGADILRGQSGNDRLVGGGGRDRLFGGAGRDFLNGSGDGRRTDRLNGGRGRDRAIAGPGDKLRAIERAKRRRR
jgi:Ca2+-binding RTX toxin-like protein